MTWIILRNTPVRGRGFISNRNRLDRAKEVLVQRLVREGLLFFPAAGVAWLLPEQPEKVG